MDQIAGLVVGLILLLILLIVMGLLLRNWLARRRQRAAEEPQDISASSVSSRRPAMAGAGANGLTTDTNDDSGTPGEGQVRSVVRPAPRRRLGAPRFWPNPPGHSGRRYTFYVEQTTTGETTPRNGANVWSGNDTGNEDQHTDESESGSQIASSPTIAMGPAGVAANRTWFGSSRFGRAI
jgi:hypothetical protein